MLTTLTLDGADGVAVTLHETTKRALVKVSGLVGVSGVRSSVRDRPNAHGVIDETRFTGGKTISLEHEVISQVSVADAMTEFRLVTAPMIQTLDVAPALMRWTEGVNGLQLQSLVKLSGDIDPPFQEGAAILNFQSQWQSEDPRAYSQTLQTVTSAALSAASGGMVQPFTFPFVFATSSSGTATVTNAGNRPTPPLFRIYGGCTNPQILIPGVARISLIGTISAGDHVDVDCADRTIKIYSAGTTIGVNRLNFYDGATSAWFEIPAATTAAPTTTLQMIAATFDATASFDTIFRSAYA